MFDHEFALRISTRGDHLNLSHLLAARDSKDTQNRVYRHVSELKVVDY